MLGYALELCDAQFGILFQYSSRTGFKLTHSKGIPQPFHDGLKRRGAFQAGVQTGFGRLVATREVVSIADVRAEEIYRRDDPLRDVTANLGGARSFAAIPMLAGARLIGTLAIYRQQVRPFEAKSLEIARTFADQSVIAIENARLLGASTERDRPRKHNG